MRISDWSSDVCSSDLWHGINRQFGELPDSKGSNCEEEEKHRPARTDGQSHETCNHAYSSSPAPLPSSALSRNAWPVTIVSPWERPFTTSTRPALRWPMVIKRALKPSAVRTKTVSLPSNVWIASSGTTITPEASVFCGNIRTDRKSTRLNSSH